MYFRNSLFVVNRKNIDTDNKRSVKQPQKPGIKLTKSRTPNILPVLRDSPQSHYSTLTWNSFLGFYLKTSDIILYIRITTFIFQRHHRHHLQHWLTSYRCRPIFHQIPTRWPMTILSCLLSCQSGHMCIVCSHKSLPCYVTKMSTRQQIVPFR